ncbi:PhnE/PtxC family ABC transporter permease, partial [Vibrio parahaemolyticus]
LVIAVVVGLLAWSWGPVEMSKSTMLVTDWRNMATFAGGFLHPNFHEWRAYIGEMIETVQIAIWGTALAVVF